MKLILVPIEDPNGVYPLKIRHNGSDNTIVSSYLYQLLPYLRGTLKAIIASKGTVGVFTGDTDIRYYLPYLRGTTTGTNTVWESEL